MDASGDPHWLVGAAEGRVGPDKCGEPRPQAAYPGDLFAACDVGKAPVKMPLGSAFFGIATRQHIECGTSQMPGKMCSLGVDVPLIEVDENNSCRRYVAGGRLSRCMQGTGYDE